VEDDLRILNARAFVGKGKSAAATGLHRLLSRSTRSCSAAEPVRIARRGRHAAASWLLLLFVWRLLDGSGSVDRGALLSIGAFAQRGRDAAGSGL
jgi:hypothetical protein